MAIIYVACSWFVGIWLATQVDLGWPGWVAGAAASVALAIGLRRQAPIALFFLCLAALCGGGARSTLARPAAAAASQVSSYNGTRLVSLSGTVAGEPVLSDSALTFRLEAERVTLAGEEWPVEGVVLVRLQRFAGVHYGDRLVLDGRLAAPPTDGIFDYRAYLARQGIYSQMLWPVLDRIEAGQQRRFFQALYAFKGRAQLTINRLLPGQEAALLSGILLGNDNGLSSSLQEAFRRTGTTHIIAISGFNIALLVGILLALARPFFRPQKAAWVPLAGVALYTLLVGADPAVVRAAIMGSLYVGASRLLGRPTFAPAGLFTAGLLMTSVNPLLLWDVGFQLSFAATLGLMLYVPPLSRRTRSWLASLAVLSRERTQQVLSFLTETLLVTMVAQVATLPLLIYHFGQMSLISLPANLLILPAQTAVMVAGGLATVVGLLAPLPAVPLAWVAGLFLRYTIGVVRVLANVPLAAISVEMGPVAVAGYYLLLLGISWLLLQDGERRRTVALNAGQQARRAIPALSGIILILAWQWARSQPDGYLHVAFLDVGQGDAIFIQTPAGRQVLVDGGRYPSRLNDRLSAYLPFWDRRLDLMVATHPDADHVAGLPDLFQRYRVDLLLKGAGAEAVAEDSPFQALVEAADTHNTAIRPARAGERIVLDEGVYLECVHPGSFALESDNDNSVSFRLVYGDFSLLLTGDAGEAGEAAMVASGLPLHSLVFKAGHHGARTSSNDFFLDAVRPRLVIISAGTENRFGHPHPEMLGRAAATGAGVLRTDELGTIEVITDGGQMWWEARR